MSKKLYVGNIPFSASEDDLRQLFSQSGAVASVKIITDRMNGRSKGYAFVEMGDEQAADNAVSALHGKEYSGRTLKVDKANPSPERSPRPHRGGGDRGGGGGGFRRGGGYGGGSSDRY